MSSSRWTPASRKVVSESIRADPDWNGGDYARPPQRWTRVVPVFTIMVDSPVRLQREAPTRKDAEALYAVLAMPSASAA